MRNIVLRTIVFASMLFVGLSFANKPAEALSAYASKSPTSVFWSNSSTKKAAIKSKKKSAKKHYKKYKKKTGVKYSKKSYSSKKRKVASRKKSKKTYKKRLAKNNRKYVPAKKVTAKNISRKTVRKRPAKKLVRKAAYRPATRTRSKTTTKGGGRYRILVAKYAAQYGVPLSIANAVVRIESNYRPHVRSHKGAVGLMQVLPSTARGMGYRGSSKGLYDPETNIKYGMKYLAGAYRRSGGSICGTVWKYNAGYYSKRMPKESQRYCRKARRMLGKK